jgi:hypothetical protein
MHTNAILALFLAELQVFDIDRLLRGIQGPYAIPDVAATPSQLKGTGGVILACKY